MNDQNPKISVIMPVYNGEKYLAEAINSILTQTFTDFEFIIINDASTDSTAQIINGFAKKDSRIRILTNKINLKIAATLNKGLNIAKGQYIARMDADDISLPHRLNLQVSFMDKHPEVGVCGSWLTIHETNKIWRPPQYNEQIKAMLLFESCLYHPTIIARKTNIIDVGKYSDEMFHAQDYDLWIKLLISGDIKFANIAESLLRYRFHHKIYRLDYKSKKMVKANKVRKKILKSIGLDPIDVEFKTHIALSYYKPAKNKVSLKRYSQWIDKLQAANKQTKFVSPEVLSCECARRINICSKNLSFTNKLINIVAPVNSLQRNFIRKIKLAIDKKRMLI